MKTQLYLSATDWGMYLMILLTD